MTAVNWARAYQEGAAAFVVLAATHERALDIVPLEARASSPSTSPPDPGALDD